MFIFNAIRQWPLGINYSEDEFNQGLSRVPFQVAHIFDDMDDTCLAHETLLGEVLDEQAPLKQKKTKTK